MTELYQELPQGAWIRVLELLPGQGDESIACRYRLANLGTDPEYEAISYVWGDPLARMQILCNGIVANVTVSLEGALRRFRYADRVRHLWIDGICINQSDDLERAEQVNMMGDIFACATKVLVWLGEDGSNQARTAFRVSRSLVEYYGAKLEVTDLGLVHEALDRLPAPPESEIFMQATNWESVRTLFSRPWFSRVWVCQEIAVAKSAELSWGPHSIQFSLLIESAFWTWDLRHVLPFDTVLQSKVFGLVATFDIIWSSYHDRESWRNEHPLIRECSTSSLASESFLLVLAAASKFEATDNRDHVYAFLSHPATKSETFARTLFKADYRKSLQSLYYELAVKLIKFDGLQVLFAVSHPSESELDKLPASWVPQWHQCKDRVTMNSMTNAWLCNVHFNSPVGVNPPMLAYAQHSNGDLVYAELHTQGLVISTISEVSSSIQQDTILQNANGPRGRNAVDDAFEMLRNHGICPSEISLAALMHLSHTMGGWKMATDDVPPDFEDFLAYCNEHCSPENLLALQQVISKGQPYYKFPSEMGSARRFAQRLDSHALDRRLFISEPGAYIGLCPSLTKAGDICCVIVATRKMPFVLRPSNRKPVPDKSFPKATLETRDRYQLIGPCYVPGIVNGELDLTSISGLQKIVIV